MENQGGLFVLQIVFQIVHQCVHRIHVYQGLSYVRHLLVSQDHLDRPDRQGRTNEEGEKRLEIPRGKQFDWPTMRISRKNKLTKDSCKIMST